MMNLDSFYIPFFVGEAGNTRWHYWAIDWVIWVSSVRDVIVTNQLSSGSQGVPPTLDTESVIPHAQQNSLGPIFHTNETLAVCRNTIVKPKFSDCQINDWKNKKRAVTITKEFRNETSSWIINYGRNGGFWVFILCLTNNAITRLLHRYTLLRNPDALIGLIPGRDDHTVYTGNISSHNSPWSPLLWEVGRKTNVIKPFISKAFPITALWIFMIRCLIPWSDAKLQFNDGKLNYYDDIYFQNIDLVTLLLKVLVQNFF